ncbi:hypothetical protein [Paenibacillus sp. OAS669]|uniref:hypothetical protein n=1 Tax=Paenibacillus sp. OAS669 TaxID=2663821 RepID=UPI0017899286|nr:hypothetical protein [Paenibacillus sp. OAS669]MBE1445632.1 hypothetical protein [Paenibacillus sp. OAS669]
MIIILMVYAIVMYLEWRYLTWKRRKPRTFFIVLGYSAASWLCLELLYFIREKWRLKDFIEAVFGPVQAILKINE